MIWLNVCVRKLHYQYIDRIDLVFRENVREVRRNSKKKNDFYQALEFKWDLVSTKLQEW